VFGGYNGAYVTSMELIDLSDEGKVCPLLPEFPLEVSYVAADFFNGKVILCGGTLSSGYSTDKCFSLGPDLRSWEELSTPLPDGPRKASASSVIGSKWLISGGVRDGPLTSTLVYDGSQFVPGPELPSFKEYHCQLTINSTHVFYGSGHSSMTFLLDWESGDTTTLQNIPIPRDNAACGLLNNENYGLEVLVAAHSYSHIFSFKDLEWRDGPKLPESIDHLGSAPVKNGFVAVGGYNGPEYLSSIYKFDETSYKWIEEEVTLGTKRRNPVSVAVPDSFAKCQ